MYKLTVKSNLEVPLPITATDYSFRCIEDKLFLHINEPCGAFLLVPVDSLNFLMVENLDDTKTKG